MFTDRLNNPLVWAAFLGVFFVCCSANTHAEKAIKWLEMDAPPYHIQQGETKNQGVVDKITNLLQQYMPDYQHSERVMNLPRVVEVMRVGQNVCHGSLYRTPEREGIAYFSAVPSTMFPPVGITIRQEDFDRFGKKSHVSIKRILSDRIFRGGISTGRSYGKVLDELLSEFDQTARLERRSGDDIYRGLINMLILGRVDYVLGSPMESGYVRHSLGNKWHVVNLMVDEHSTYDFGYVACSKTEWGKQVMGDINRLLIQLRPLDIYKAFFTQWLDELSQSSFEKAYQQQFLTRGLSVKP